MTTDTEFWTHVDALLDARRDPFADAEVARALLHEPARLAQLEALLARLEPNALTAAASTVHTPVSTARATATDPTSSAQSAAPATHAPRRAPTTRRAAAALLLLGAAALATWLATRSGSRERARPDQLVADTQHAEPAQVDAPDLLDAPHVAPAPLARVVEFHASVRRERLGHATPRASLPASTAHTPPRIHSDWRQTWSAP